jgi:hypothetical protein
MVDRAIDFEIIDQGKLKHIILWLMCTYIEINYSYNYLKTHIDPHSGSFFW